jgi:hypothetical protein
MLTTPRLWTTNGATGLYLALSYCWGKVEVVGTLKENVQGFHDELPWDDLPQTIKDAITATKRLGIRYLWVDALCIVQDDHDDWAAEAKRMSNVYKLSLCTIAATGSTHANSGLFQPR